MLEISRSTLIEQLYSPREVFSFSVRFVTCTVAVRRIRHDTIRYGIFTYARKLASL